MSQKTVYPTSGVCSQAIVIELDTMWLKALSS